MNHVDGLVDCDDSKLLHLGKQEDHGLVPTLQQVKLSLLEQADSIVLIGSGACYGEDTNAIHTRENWSFVLEGHQPC